MRISRNTFSFPIDKNNIMAQSEKHTWECAMKKDRELMMKDRELQGTKHIVLVFLLFLNYKHT